MSLLAQCLDFQYIIETSMMIISFCNYKIGVTLHFYSFSKYLYVFLLNICYKIHHQEVTCHSISHNTYICFGLISFIFSVDIYISFVPISERRVEDMSKQHNDETVVELVSTIFEHVSISIPSSSS